MTRPRTPLPGSPGAPALPAPSARSRPVRAEPRTFCSFLFRRAPRRRRSGRAQAELRRGPPPRPQARARRGQRTGGEGGREGAASSARRVPAPRPCPHPAPPPSDPAAAAEHLPSGGSHSARELQAGELLLRRRAR